MSCFDAECWQEIFRSCCKCCCCCDSVILKFKVGSPSTPEFQQGCNCSTPLLGNYPFPNFDENEIRIQSVASIPCTDLIVTVSSTCCLKCSGGSVVAVGDGIVSAGINSGAEDCGPYTLTINGSAPPIVAHDGDGLNVVVSAANPDCCVIGPDECQDATWPDCSSFSSSSLYIYRNGTLYLNPKYKEHFTKKSTKTKRPIELKKRIIKKLMM